MTQQEILFIGVQLQYLFGGTVRTRYDTVRRLNVWEIENDDIGYMEMTATDGCLFWESFNTRIKRMCEEYDGYMRYKYRDERSANHVQETIEEIMQAYDCPYVLPIS